MFNGLDSFSKKLNLVHISDLIQAIQQSASIGKQKLESLMRSRKYESLDKVVPGYYSLSPRSQCDKAMSQLIKDMKDQGIKANKVFSMAAGEQYECSCAQLVYSLQKQAPRINPDLIGDAMKSFGGPNELVS